MQTVSPPKLRARDAVRIVRFNALATPFALVEQFARLRLEHPGGVPTFIPRFNAFAVVEERVVASIGWIEETDEIRVCCEINRVPDHWGRIGVLVLIRGFVQSTHAIGRRAQALIMPGNEDLKRALLQVGAAPVVEIWEAPFPHEEIL